MEHTEKRWKEIKHSVVFLLPVMILMMTGFTTASGQHEFITTWQATGNVITIPAEGGGYNYNVSWEEIGNPANNGSATGVTGDHTISLPNTNQYRVKITGQFPRIYFNDGGDKNKILTVEQWGNVAWTNMSAAFFGCGNLTVPAADGFPVWWATNGQHLN